MTVNLHNMCRKGRSGSRYGPADREFACLARLECGRVGYNFLRQHFPYGFPSLPVLKHYKNKFKEEVCLNGGGLFTDVIKMYKKIFLRLGWGDKANLLGPLQLTFDTVAVRALLAAIKDRPRTGAGDDDPEDRCLLLGLKAVQDPVSKKWQFSAKAYSISQVLDLMGTHGKASLQLVGAYTADHPDSPLLGSFVIGHDNQFSADTLTAWIKCLVDVWVKEYFPVKNIACDMENKHAAFLNSLLSGAFQRQDTITNSSAVIADRVNLASVTDTSDLAAQLADSAGTGLRLASPATHLADAAGPAAHLTGAAGPTVDVSDAPLAYGPDGAPMETPALRVLHKYLLSVAPTGQHKLVGWIVDLVKALGAHGFIVCPFPDVLHAIGCARNMLLTMEKFFPSPKGDVNIQFLNEVLKDIMANPTSEKLQAHITKNTINAAQKMDKSLGFDAFRPLVRDLAERLRAEQLLPYFNEATQATETARLPSDAIASVVYAFLHDTSAELTLNETMETEHRVLMAGCIHHLCDAWDKWIRSQTEYYRAA